MGLFGQSNLHRRLDFCPDQPARNQIHQAKLVFKILLSNLYTVYEGSSIDPDSYEVIRVIIWARESVFGRKPPGDFCIAVCELAGQVDPNC